MGTDWERWEKIGKVKKRWGGIGREGRNRERWEGTARGVEEYGEVGRDREKWEGTAKGRMR